jgi:nucleotide-binding universal stress UspA family protein
MGVFSRILVPVDSSEESSAAVALAARLARESEADELCFCYVVDKDADYREAAMVDAGSYAENLVEETEHSGTEAVERAKALAGAIGVPLNTELLEGDPPSAIAELAKKRGFDLIVTGTHGYEGIQRLLFGSVAEKIMRRSEVPVLMVKRP